MCVSPFLYWRISIYLLYAFRSSLLAPYSQANSFDRPRATYGKKESPNSSITASRPSSPTELRSSPLVNLMAPALPICCPSKVISIGGTLLQRRLLPSRPQRFSPCSRHRRRQPSSNARAMLSVANAVSSGIRASLMASLAWAKK